MIIAFAGLPEGSYAVSVYQDSNGILTSAAPECYTLCGKYPGGRIKAIPRGSGPRDCGFNSRPPDFQTSKGFKGRIYALGRL